MKPFVDTEIALYTLDTQMRTHVHI